MSSLSVELVDISATITIDNKYRGGVTAPNGKVVFVLRNAGGVGMYDAVASAFAYYDISSTVTKNGVPDSTTSFISKFHWGCLAPNGLVVFAPNDADGIGLFNAETEMFTWVDISATLSGSNKFKGAALAPNGLVVFSRCACCPAFPSALRLHPTL